MSHDASESILIWFDAPENLYLLWKMLKIDVLLYIFLQTMHIIIIIIILEIICSILNVFTATFVQLYSLLPNKVN